MKIQCPSCDQRLEIPDELAGQTIECPSCNASLAVPALASAPSAPVQVQQSAPQVKSKKESKTQISKIAIITAILFFVFIASSSNSKDDLITTHEKFLKIHSTWVKTINETRSVKIKQNATDKALVNLEKLDVDHLRSDYAAAFNFYMTSMAGMNVALLIDQLGSDEDAKALWKEGQDLRNDAIKEMNAIYKNSK